VAPRDFNEVGAFSNMRNQYAYIPRYRATQTQIDEQMSEWQREQDRRELADEETNEDTTKIPIQGTNDSPKST